MVRPQLAFPVSPLCGCLSWVWGQRSNPPPTPPGRKMENHSSGDSLRSETTAEVLSGTCIKVILSQVFYPMAAQLASESDAAIGSRCTTASHDLTHWGWDKMAAIFKYIFFNENVWTSIKISLKFVPKGPIYNIPALVQIMAWCHPGNKPLSEPTVISLLIHTWVTQPQWVNP